MHSATRSQGRGLAPCSDARPAQYLPTRENDPRKRVFSFRKAATLGGFALLAQLVEHLHGKEGVDGSSPSEGSAKTPQLGLFLSAPLALFPACARYGALYGAFRSKTRSWRAALPDRAAPMALRGVAASSRRRLGPS
jgi:hypothetical protein